MTRIGKTLLVLFATAASMAAVAKISADYATQWPLTLGQEDAGAYNLRKHNDVRATYTAGGIILILALTGFLRKRLKKASVT